MWSRAKKRTYMDPCVQHSALHAVRASTADTKLRAPATQPTDARHCDLRVRLSSQESIQAFRKLARKPSFSPNKKRTRFFFHTRILDVRKFSTWRVSICAIDANTWHLNYAQSYAIFPHLAHFFPATENNFSSLTRVFLPLLKKTLCGSILFFLLTSENSSELTVWRIRQKRQQRDWM